MGAWSLEFSEGAELDLAKLDRPVRRQIIRKLEWFIQNFDSLFPLPLHGEFKEFYKLRVGDWRVFYRINWSGRVIIISYVENRRKAYRSRE